MNTFDDIVRRILENRMMTHILYWIGVFLLFCIYGLGYGQPVIVTFFVKMVDLPVQIIAYYTFMYWQLPLLLKKRYWSFALAFILMTYPFYLLVHFNHDFGIGTYLISWHKPHDAWTILTDLEFYFRNMVDVYLVVFISATIKFIKDHLESRQLIEDLESEMTKVEYNILQAKIQPQLMLRSLQLIKSMSIEGHQNTPHLIADLSEVLDDAIYQSRQEERPLEEEVDKLETYAHLYARSSSKIDKIKVERALGNGTSKIRTLVLNNLTEVILDQIEAKSTKEVNLNILTLVQKDECIFQVVIEPTLSFDVDQSKLENLLGMVYQKRYFFEVINDTESTSIQVKIKL